MDKVEVTQADRVRDALMDAYISGAQEVHDAWVNCGGRCPGERMIWARAQATMWRG